MNPAWPKFEKYLLSSDSASPGPQKTIALPRSNTINGFKRASP
jgi:hypothetical protein